MSVVNRKRKADEDLSNRHDRLFRDDSVDLDDRMSASPTNSPNIPSRPLPTPRTTKRIRTNVTGRRLPLARALEAVDPSQIKSILQALCEKHPALVPEVESLLPKPTVQNSLSLLSEYERALSNAFPYGGNSAGDYAYNRVRSSLTQLLDALSDYTPHFLPPNENLAATSLEFLDGATNIIHRLPHWTNPAHNYHKTSAYEEITKAWVLVIREAAKRGAGISLQYGGWDSKLAKHNELSGGNMEAAITEMRHCLGWLNSNENPRGMQPHARAGGNALGFSIRPTGVQVPVRIW